MKSNANADALSRNPTSILHVSSDSESSFASISSTSQSALDGFTYFHIILFRNTETTFFRQWRYRYPELGIDKTKFHNGRLTIIYTRDRIVMRKDNLFWLIALDGSPLDLAATYLYKQHKLSSINGLILSRAKVTRLGNHHLILFPCIPTHGITRESLLECFRSLYDVTMELGLSSFSISQFSLKGISWYSIQCMLLDLFEQTNVQIFACY